MIVKEASVCDVCKLKLTKQKCEMCHSDICNNCCSQNFISVRGIRIFAYCICKECNRKFEGIKVDIKLDDKLIENIKEQLNDQLKKAVCLNVMRQEE